MQIKPNKAFTLVELIVTITILAILGTIGFLSVQNYTVYSRDVVRATDLKNIKSVLEYTYTESWQYPVADSWTWITFSGWLVWTQWTFWKKAKRASKRLYKVPVDPLTGNEYTYSVLNTNSEYELWWVFEWDEIGLNNDIIWSTYADNSDFKAYITWNYNWRFAKATDWSSDYILAVPSIINTDIWETNLVDIIDNKKLSLRWFKNIPHSYGVEYTPENDEDVKFVNPTNLVVFSWSIDDLKENEWDRIILISNLQKAYSWTLSQDNSWIKEIVNTEIDISSPSIVAQNLSATLVNMWFINKESDKIALVSISSEESDWETINDWRSIDPNCDLADVTIWSQTWAGCNSTIWTWIEYDVDQSCYNYVWWATTWCNLTSNTKENSYNSTYWVNNIWWKLYTWDNSSSACTTWYRVPSDTEWTTLTNYLEWNKWDSNIWWAWHSAQNSTNNMLEALKLPLAGRQLADGTTFNRRGYSNYLWSSTPSGTSAYFRYLGWSISTVIRSSNAKTSSFSVRCIKD